MEACRNVYNTGVITPKSAELLSVFSQKIPYKYPHVRVSKIIPSAKKYNSLTFFDL